MSPPNRTLWRFGLLALVMPTPMALTACFPVYLNYHLYEPSVDLCPEAACATRGFSTVRTAPNVLRLAFTDIGAEISVATYDPDSYRQFIYHAALFGNRTELLSDRHSTREIQLRISLVCSSATGLAWTPGRMRLVDQPTGRDIALRKFAEFVPAEPVPSARIINEGVGIDRGDPVTCQRRRPRSVVATFDFDPAFTDLRLDFAGSLALDQALLDGPSIRLRLVSRSEYLYRRMGLQFGELRSESSDVAVHSTHRAEKLGTSSRSFPVRWDTTPDQASRRGSGFAGLPADGRLGG